MSGRSFYQVKPIRGGRPMDQLYTQLAADPDWVCQAKLDGQRALWEDGTLWSRRDLPIVRSAEVLEALEGVAETLDGEFVPVVGEKRGTFWVFDLPDHRGTLAERWAVLEKLVKSIGSDVVRLCPTEVLWPQVEDEGWEGVVFKRRDSRYKKSAADGHTYAAWVKYRAEWL